MRLHNSQKTGRIAKACLILMTTTALAACGAMGGGVRPAASVASIVPVNGPQADYPVVIGAPYQVDGTQYTPADVLNYDEVGYLTAGSGEGISGAHHTLPVPSYVEVTSLETGRTILLRLEQRGPMESNHLVALSPAAMEQLGASQDTPVRVRRVNPPEAQRAMLRGDQAAPLRMDTPMPLVTVLRRRLPEEGSASLRPANAPAPVQPVIAEATEELEPVELAQSDPAPALAVTDWTAPLPTDEPMTQGAEAEPEAPMLPSGWASGTLVSFEEAFSVDQEPPEEATAEAVVLPEVVPDQLSGPEAAEEPAATQPVVGGFVVQAAAFSTAERAERAADALGGQVTQSGQYYRVRTGPFSTRAQAEASLANVQAAGYSDARIYTNG